MQRARCNCPAMSRRVLRLLALRLLSPHSRAEQQRVQSASRLLALRAVPAFGRGGTATDVGAYPEDRPVGSEGRPG